MIISLIEHYIMQASSVSHTPIKATLLELTMPNRNLIDERPHILTEFCNRKQLLIEADGINFFFIRNNDMLSNYSLVHNRR